MTAAGQLPRRDARGFDGRVGGGGIFLVGAVESAFAAVDAVDPQTFSFTGGDRQAIAADQPAANGSAAARAKDAAVQALHSECPPK